MASNIDYFARKDSFRSFLSSQDHSKPHTFAFHPNGRLVFFLGSCQPSYSSTLYAVDLQSEDAVLPWKPVLESLKPPGNLTKEEILLRERMRAVGTGLTSYIFDEKTGMFLFKSGDFLFTIDVLDYTDLSKFPVTPSEIPNCTNGGYNDLKFSPDSKIISFIRGGEVYLKCKSSGTETKITNAKLGGQHISAGVAEYVVQEEFDRYTGYWWSPAIEEKAGGVTSYCIAYIEIDEKGVETVFIPSGSHDGTVDEYMFPKPGNKNATSKIFIAFVDVQYGEKGVESVSVKHKEISSFKGDTFSWVEYIVTAGWTRDGTGVWFQFIDRVQQKLQLAVFDVNESTTHGAEYSPIVAWEETSKFWINCGTGQINFLSAKNEEGSKLSESGSLIYASEKTGFRHFYFVKYGKGNDTIVRQVTDGNWVALPSAVVIDEEKERIFFTANISNPTERQLCVVSFGEGEQERKVVQLSASGFTSSSALSSNGKIVVITESNLNTPFHTFAFRIDEADKRVFLQQLRQIEHPESATYSVIPKNLPEMFTFTTKDGLQLYGLYYKPVNYQPGRTYPTILYVYGGPHVQLVLQSYALSRHAEFQILTSQGFLVAVIDGRGSNNRGFEFESHIYQKMGTVELQDQVQGVEYLIGQGLVDPERIAIYGWSYGGYMSLMGLCQRPDFFRAAISCAPVTEWQLYDTAYTERYMNLPSTNATGYTDGSVVGRVNGFPNEPNRLLLTHGMLDENVHFVHSARLIQAMLLAGKPHQLNFLPNERHGIRNIGIRSHFWSTVLTFLAKAFDPLANQTESK